MTISRILTALAFAAAALLTCGCGSSSFKNCSDTRSCSGTGGTDGGMAGSGGIGGAAGNGGTAGATEGGAGTAGTGGGSGLDNNGATCTDGSACKSGNCIDGVCCDTPCDGTCEACNVSGSEGTCTPYDNGTDPESECLGSANAGDPCAGTCDGNGACTFPDSTTSCGNPMCASGQQTTYGCGGDGSCSTKQTDCGNYTCGSSVCRTSCTTDTQCASSAWCNPSNACVDKIADGSACGGNNQCTNGHCVSAVCCHTSCAAPASCSTGTCLCNGVACASGHACITWYLDQDGDGHAASSSYDKVGCDNQQPANVGGHTYYATADDCDDTDANAHPGQTGWFKTQSNGGTWDYNCNGTTDHQYVTESTVQTQTCHACAAGTCMGATWGYECSGACALVTKAYKNTTGIQPVACGQTKTLYTCTSSGETTQNVQQGCH